ncbi:MAG: radical SAM protein [Thermodesulfobacteriota bacterium]
MKIVLTTSPAVTDRHGVKSLPPLQLGYVAAGIKDVPGTTLKILDSYGEDLNTEQAVQRALELSPDVLGISSTSFCFTDGLDFIRAVKRAKPDVMTVMGGYHATMFDNLLLRDVQELDAVIRGEGDESFPELCRRLLNGEPTAGIPGLSYRANGDVVRGIPQQMEDLDSLPFPDRSLFEFKDYFEQFGRFELPAVPPAANVITSRSCPYHCTFCPKLFPEWRYRMRSARNVFDELVELSRKGIEVAFFQDENFSFDIPRVNELCRLIIEHKLPMRFLFQGTIHHLPPETWGLLHKAGFDLLFVGIETGSDAQLRRYRKAATNKGLTQGVRNAKKAHMLVVGFFIHGGPGETLEDCEHTHKFIREVGPHACGASELSVQPGTILWDQLVGNDTPPDLDATYPRRIHEFPGQHDEKEISRRRRSFGKALADSWRSVGRIAEILDLLIYNKTCRHIFKHLITRPGALLQLIRGGPK